jgi:hypothetical protein
MKQIKKPTDLVEALQHALLDDGDYKEDHLLDLYKRADELGRAWIDCAFINLCGWSLPTLAKHCGQKLPQSKANPFMTTDGIPFADQRKAHKAKTNPYK